MNYWNWNTYEGHLQTFSKPEIQTLTKMADLKLVLLKTLYFHLPKTKRNFPFLLKIFPLQVEDLFFIIKK